MSVEVGDIETRNGQDYRYNGARWVLVVAATPRESALTAERDALRAQLSSQEADIADIVTRQAELLIAPIRAQLSDAVRLLRNPLELATSASSTLDVVIGLNRWWRDRNDLIASYEANQGEQ